MSNGIVGLPAYRSGGLLDRIKRLLKGQSEEEQAADDRRKAAERFEKRAGPAIDDSTLRSMQPLLDSLQHMTGPVPEGDGYTGYSESGEIPFSVRPEDPQIASGEATGVYYPPSQQWQENIIIDPEGRNPRFTAAHEIGHAVHMRDPKGEIGWLSPELRKAMESGEAPFDTEGYYSTDEPGQRVADYVGDAITFLQTSTDPTINPEYTRQFLSDRPHLQRVTEELLQIPIYQEHPFLTGSLGEAYEPELRRGAIPDSWLENPPDFTPAQVARIDELARNIDMGMSFSFQEGDTDAILNAVERKLDVITGPRYRSRFRPASPPTPPR